MLLIKINVADVWNTDTLEYLFLQNWDCLKKQFTTFFYIFEFFKNSENLNFDMSFVDTEGKIIKIFLNFLK